MATIDVFPLSIGGVKAPLNLLDQILNTNNYENLVYPIDLVSNPIYGHSIQFRIFEYEYKNIQQAYDKTVKAVGGVINETMNNGLPTQTSILNAGKTFVDEAKKTNPESILNFASNFKSTNFMPERGANLATVSLYMPDTLYTSFDSDYTTMSLTSTFGMAGYLANAAADEKFRSAFLSKDKDYSQILQSDFGKGVLGPYAAAAAVAGIGGDFGGAAGLFQQALKKVPNPQLQLLYKGIGLREFQFEFLFTPVSSQEADSVDQIIKTFMYYSLPSLSSGENGSQFLTPPQIFNIKFAYTGSQGVLGQVTNVFQTTMNNLLGTSIINGNPTGEINNNTAAKLFDIGDCVLSNVTVDYAPNGWATYQDGFPVQTRLTLQFKEMNIRTKQNMTNFKGAPPQVTTGTATPWNEKINTGLV